MLNARAEREGASILSQAHDKRQVGTWTHLNYSAGREARGAPANELPRASAIAASVEIRLVRGGDGEPANLAATCNMKSYPDGPGESRRLLLF